MELKFQKERLALIIIDVQTLFTSIDGPFGNGEDNSGYASMITTINELSTNVRKTSIPVIFSRYGFSPDASDAGLLRDHPVVKSGAFSIDSKWTVLDERLVVAKHDLHLSRNRPGAFHGGELENTLATLKRDQLIVVGLSVNNAISTTAREAFARDISPLIVKDCVAAAPFERVDDTYFEILDTWTAKVASLNEVAGMMSI